MNRTPGRIDQEEQKVEGCPQLLPEAHKN